jgi:hypothetical protein
MRTLVAGVIAALIAGPLILTGTASAEQPTFKCWLKDEGPGSESPDSTNFVLVPSKEYPNKSVAQKDMYIRCFAQRP